MFFSFFFFAQSGKGKREKKLLGFFYVYSGMYMSFSVVKWFLERNQNSDSATASCRLLDAFVNYYLHWSLIWGFLITKESWFNCSLLWPVTDRLVSCVLVRVFILFDLTVFIHAPTLQTHTTQIFLFFPSFIATYYYSWNLWD